MPVPKEPLTGRVKLEPADSAVCDQLAGLAYAELALVRVDARKGDHDVAVVARRIDDLLVVDPAHAHLVLGVDREHHEADAAFAVIRNGLGDRRALAGLEVAARRCFVFAPDLVLRLAARDFRMGVDVDRNQIRDVH
jgi:hypothetical protein